MTSSIEPAARAARPRRGRITAAAASAFLFAALLAAPAAVSAEPDKASAARGHGEGMGLALPGGVMINGKFGANYERRDYTDDPSDGNSAFTNYHHFIFISRKSPNDPLYFSAEIIDRNFYYFGARFKLDDSAWTLSAEAGKVMVPFGADPLFHHSYGGLSGFDQQVLPTVWAQLGVVGRAQYRFDEGHLKLEAFLVQGYGLSDRDGALDLRSDISGSGDIEAAIGMRAGFSYGPATFYYSVLFNDLGFDRQLVMQALDISLWGIPGVTFLEDLVLSVGVMRADLFGGDPESTYEFADYLELRYKPLPYLFFWYRTGLHTENNASGLFYDDKDVGPGDESAHSVGVGTRFHGLTVRLSHTWRLEKDIEFDNDFIRLNMTYDF